MKTIKRATAILLSVIAIAVVLSCFSVPVSAASAGIHNANLTGGQVVYVTTNDTWNTYLPGGLFQTYVKITLPLFCRADYSKSVTGDTAAMQITTYKMIDGEWVEQPKLSGSFHCNPYSGLIEDGLRLPGKGVDYKLVIVPECTENVQTPSDMTGLKLELSNGSLTDVQ